MECIEFAKLSGSGNDFICIDGRDGRFDEMICSGSMARFARVLCCRGIGIGGDGVILAVAPEIEDVADIGARFFEADGSEAELCGNGTGCFVHWVSGNGWVPPGEIRILTPAGVVRGQNSIDGYVRVCIPSPEDLQRHLELQVEGRRWNCDFVVVGVPHVVTYVDDVDEVDVAHWGPRIRHHERFRPRGANANFVQVLGEGRIAVRTYEFGVEGETLACGTGSAAAAILTAVREDWPEKYIRGDEPVLIRARSGDVLKVYFTLQDDGSAEDVCLETIVRRVFSGCIDPELVARALGARAKRPNVCTA